MRTLRAWLLRFCGLFNKQSHDRELAAELESHLQMHIEDNLRAGMAPEEARRQALIKLGGVEQAKEKYRDRRGLPCLESLLQDVRFGLRMLRKNPGFTTVAVLTLALGIGANTAIFSLIDALLLSSLPVRDPQELFVLQGSAHKQPKFHSISSYGDCVDGRIRVNDVRSCSFSLPFFKELRDQTSVFSSLTASGGTGELDLSGNGPASMVRALFVSGNYFDTLGVRPAIGRTLDSHDDQPSAPSVAVLRYGYWQTEFGGSPSVIGKTVSLNRVPTMIVGVAERRFTGLTPGSAPDAWLPLSVSSGTRFVRDPTEEDAGSIWMLILGRLKPDVPRENAQVAVSLLFRDAMLYGPRPFSTEADAPAVALLPAQSGLSGARGTYSTPLFILMVAVGIVLLIASANVAGLLLARSRARQKEMAVRLALGAGRGRVMRQLLTESMLLASFGGLLGIAVAVWGARAILAFVASGSSQPLGISASIDYRVLLFTLAIVLSAGIFFGLAPATLGTRVDLTPALKGGAGATAAWSRHRWLGNLLVVSQVALTMIVLMGAGLVMRTLQNLRNTDPGFDITNILNFTIDPVLIGYKGAKLDTLYRSLQDRLSAIPSVTSVTFSDRVLLNGDLWTTDLRFGGASEKSSPESDYVEVGPNFFATMKMPLLEGRDFSPADYVTSHYAAAVSASASTLANSSAAPAPHAVIVNETFVRRFLGNAYPLGGRFWHANAKPNDPGYVIVGVVHDAKDNNLRREIQPTIYAPVTSGWAFELRTARSPDSIVPAVRSIVKQIDSNLPITKIMTESESIDRLLFQERLIARLASFFGALAIVLACIGLYGLLSYEVTRRTREIGIRVALGAGQCNVLRIVVGQGLALAVTGMVIGIAAAFGVTRYLGSILYDVHPSDPVTLSAVAAILLLVAFVTCFIPARRAMRVDPIVALRHE